MRASYVFLVSALLIVSPSSLGSVSPAHFGKYAERFAKKIKLPKDFEFGEEITIRCSGYADRSGVFVPRYCDAPEDVEYAIVVKTQRWKRPINAAKVNKRRRSAWFQFSVRVRRSDAGDRVTLTMNHGHSRDKFGDDYTAPQIYRFVSMRKDPCPLEHTVKVAGVVGTDGRAKSAKVIASDAPKNCNLEKLRFFANSVYIPAHHDGSPVEAPLIMRFVRQRGAKRSRIPIHREDTLSSVMREGYTF